MLAMATSTRCRSSSQALTAVFALRSGRLTGLPTFLVPAVSLSTAHPALHFSTTPQRCSKIGRAPLSLPPEVTFTVFDPPKLKRAQASRVEPRRTVEVQGPLGTMAMEIPPYIQIESDDESRTHSLTIADANDKKQKAMWGEHNILSLHQACWSNHNQVPFEHIYKTTSSASVKATTLSFVLWE